MQGMFVLVRTYTAGDHMGTLESEDGQTVTLKDARRLWRWRGANTLNEIALNGASMDYTRISAAVPAVKLLDAIEIMPCSDVARENLTQSRWGN